MGGAPASLPAIGFHDSRAHVAKQCLPFSPTGHHQRVCRAACGVAAESPATEGACCGGRAAVVVGGREIEMPQAVMPPNSRLPQLVDLGAGKCIPCKLMAPILDELKSNYVGRLDVQVIDVWQNPAAGKPYQIRMIPTQIFIGTNGKEVFRHEGFFSKEDILAKWLELGVNLK